MLADRGLLESLLNYIGKRLHHEVEGLLIGGNAMIFYGLREQTKDLDLVFFKRQDIAGIVQIIKNHPLFKGSSVAKRIPYEVNPEVSQREPTVIESKDLPRFDIFYRYVFSVDAKEFLNRCKRSLRFDLLKLKLLEPEDMVFLKGVTGRDVDKEDIVRIIKNVQIDWKSFVEFSKKYYKKDKKVVWLVLDSLYEINEKEKLIPRNVLEDLAGLFKMKL
jgi:hypothetical protein